MGNIIKNIIKSIIEGIKKIAQSKHGIVKIIIIVVAVILGIRLIGGLFGDSRVKGAGEYITKLYTHVHEGYNDTNIKVSAKAIGKNKGANMYAFDVVETYKDVYGADNKDYSFVIVKYDNNEYHEYTYRYYSDENKSQAKDYIIAILAKG